MERICIYPGSFDPITVGHMDIIRRASRLFDKVVVAVLHNPAKKGCFPVSDRLTLIRKACAGLPNVEVDSFSGLLADYVEKTGAVAVIRGLRGESDFANEALMAQVNQRLNPHAETLMMMTKPEHACVSSSVVREVAGFGGDIAPFVPAEIFADVKALFDQQQEGGTCHGQHRG